MTDGRASSSAARERLKGILVIDFVVPDYYAKSPKPCMGGWGTRHHQRHAVGPRAALPCGGKPSRTSSSTTSATSRWREIWLNGSGLPEVPRHRLDEGAVPDLRRGARSTYGGCRCQAFALTGDATNTDPACSLSPLHAGLGKAGRGRKSATTRRRTSSTAPDGRRRSRLPLISALSASDCDSAFASARTNPDWCPRGTRVRHRVQSKFTRLATFTIAIRDTRESNDVVDQ